MKRAHLTLEGRKFIQHGLEEGKKATCCYDGHKYEDYLKFKEKNPEISTAEMDTVFNNPEGPYVQTFIFENAPLMIGFFTVICKC